MRGKLNEHKESNTAHVRNKMKIKKESLFWKLNPGSQQGVQPLFTHYQRAPTSLKGTGFPLSFGLKMSHLGSKEGSQVSLTPRQPRPLQPALQPVQWGTGKGGLQAVERADFLPLTFADPSAKTLFSAAPETRVVCYRSVATCIHTSGHTSLIHFCLSSS